MEVKKYNTDTTVTVQHRFCAGHTVTGHKQIDSEGNTTTVKGKCANLHGHNYTMEVTLQAKGPSSALIDEHNGMLLDFTEIKIRISNMVDLMWDHRFLIYKEDERCASLKSVEEAVVVLDFNPTVERMANELLKQLNDMFLALGNGVEVQKLSLYESPSSFTTVTNNSLEG